MANSMFAGTPVHLWVYNHPPHGISDQVEFFIAIMRQNGHGVTMGRLPRQDALNVVIENFSDETSAILMNFCRETGKRVSVIMTEHLDFIDREIYIHGDPLWSDNDYMHPATQISRIRNLMDCACYIRGFFVLGDLPQLLNMNMMMPGVAVRTLPFPVLTWPEDTPHWAALPADLVFTGAVTGYRAELIDVLKSQLVVRHPDGFLSRKGRDKFCQLGRLNLNIPQRPDWQWLSLMRIIAALRCGRATVSLGTRDTSKIASCCVQIDMQAGAYLTQLRDLTAQAEKIFAMAFAGYHAMAEEYLREHPFPADFFDYWAITEL